MGRGVGDDFHVALYMVNLGEMAHLSGDLVRAKELFSQVRQLAERRGDRRHLSMAC